MAYFTIEKASPWAPPPAPPLYPRAVGCGHVDPSMPTWSSDHCSSTINEGETFLQIDFRWRDSSAHNI